MTAVVLLFAGGRAVAGTPTGDAFGDMQELDVEASPPVAGAGIVFDLQQTYWNTFGLTSLRAPSAIVIHFPRGVVWNGALFPQCEPARLAAHCPEACPRGSRFATARVVAAVGALGVTTTARVTDFVGTALNGHPTQLLYVVPALGAPFVLTGVIRAQPAGAFGLSETVDSRSCRAERPGSHHRSSSPQSTTSTCTSASRESSAAEPCTSL